jgi:hypothetical protein
MAALKGSRFRNLEYIILRRLFIFHCSTTLHDLIRIHSDPQAFGLLFGFRGFSDACIRFLALRSRNVVFNNVFCLLTSSAPRTKVNMQHAIHHQGICFQPLRHSEVSSTDPSAKGAAIPSFIASCCGCSLTI